MDSLALVEERELLVVRTEVGEADAEESDGGAARSRVFEDVANHRIEFELRAGRRDRARAHQRLEVRVAKLEGDGSRFHAALSGSPAHPFAERAQHRFDARRIAHVFAEGALVRDGPDGAARRIVLQECRTLAAKLVRSMAAATALNRLGPRSEDASQRRKRGRHHVCECRQPNRVELLLCHRSDARKLSHWQRAEKRARRRAASRVRTPPSRPNGSSQCRRSTASRRALRSRP